MTLPLEIYEIMALVVLIVLHVVIWAYAKRIREVHMLTILDSFTSGIGIHEINLIRYAEYYDSRLLLGSHTEFLRSLMQSKYISIDGSHIFTITGKGEAWLKKYKHGHNLPTKGP